MGLTAYNFDTFVCFQGIVVMVSLWLKLVFAVHKFINHMVVKIKLFSQQKQLLRLTFFLNWMFCVPTQQILRIISYIGSTLFLKAYITRD